MGHQKFVLDTDESAANLMNNSSQNIDRRWEQQVNLIEALNNLPVLGLQLTPTPSLLERVNQILLRRAGGYGFNGGREQPNNSNAYAHAMINAQSRESLLQQANKLKAENFSVTLLRIGSWERVTKNAGDLVAKCYFAKRKLVWEFLENGLKRKMEIQWSDILSLKTVCLEGQSGILEIELLQPPKFYHEMDPKPRKHTQWRMVTDFTGGQASSYRRHYLQCPPGTLDKPLEKLLRYDSRIFQLSQQGFPSLESPFFPKLTDFSFDFGGQLLMNPQQQQLSFSNIPAPDQTYQPAALDTPMSEYDNNNEMPWWEDQGRTVMMPMMPCNASSSIAFRNNYTQSSSQNQLGAGGLISMQQQQQQPSMFQTLNDHHQNMLLNNSQFGVSNMVDNSVLMNNAVSNNTVIGGGQMYPQIMNWPPDNNSMSSPDNNDDLNHEINNMAPHGFNRNKWQ